VRIVPDPSVTSSNADDLESLITRGGEFLQEDKVEEARDCFDGALKLSPDHEKALGLLGLTHFRLSDFESASGIYEKLVAKNPDDASYRLNLGLVHLKLDRPVEAIAELGKSRDLDPSQIRTVSYLGLAYARNGEYEDAYEAFLRADQSNLATEMEQYLDEETRQAIRDRVGSSDVVSSAPDAQSTDDAEMMFHSESAAELEPDAPADAELSESTPAASTPAEATDAAEADAASAPQALPDSGMITQAVDVVQPSAIAAVADAAPGHIAPEPVALFATRRLIRPNEGGQTLEIGAGGVLIAQVHKRLISRTEGVMVSSGELGFEPATRRIRGQQTDEVFGSGDAKLFLVTGEGYLLASAGGDHFTALSLDNDVVYLREECVFAFDPGLRWENGRIPGSEFRVTQFRGNGCVAMRTPKEPLSVRLSSERVMYVDSEALAGWIGRVVPRLIKPAAGGRTSSPFVECSGEGVVLLHDLQGAS
tara:strand:- start:7516 stop:8952 length:1437 start_codon:yes stop_codon:yes gene_type:complete